MLLIICIYKAISTATMWVYKHAWKEECFLAFSIKFLLISHLNMYTVNKYFLNHPFEIEKSPFFTYDIR